MQKIKSYVNTFLFCLFLPFLFTVNFFWSVWCNVKYCPALYRYLRLLRIYRAQRVNFEKQFFGDLH